MIKKINKNISKVLLGVSILITLSSCTNSINYENGEVYVDNWGEYIDETVIEQFEEKYKIKVIYDTFETNEELYPIISIGSVNYDVVCPSEYMIKKMIDNNLLQKLDFSKLSLAKSNTGKEYFEMYQFIDKDNEYTVPYMTGTVGILVNKTRLKEMGLSDITSWADLWKEEYKGEILMQNSVRDAFMVALKKNGFSLNSKNVDEIEKAKEDLILQKPLVQAYVVDQVRDKMISGEAMIAVIYSGEALYVEKENKNFEYEYIIPKEGSNFWGDGWVIPRNAKNVENAHKWIDFMCDENIAKLNAEYITYTSPNEKAKEIIDPEAQLDEKKIKDYSNNNMEMFDYLGEDVEKIYSDSWKEVLGE